MTERPTFSGAWKIRAKLQQVSARLWRGSKESAVAEFVAEEKKRHRKRETKGKPL